MLPLEHVRILPRLSKGIKELNPWSRLYHTATAKFTTIDAKGIPISYNTGIMVGEPEESYVYVEPEVGNAIESAIFHQLKSGAPSHPKTLPLQFHHDSHHFAHKSFERMSRESASKLKGALEKLKDS
ncbi:hypothetical protein EsDP_00006417 [Epichloe bromicola]|uniref:Uncharacterized protein n=1 Tax=Epichloe bromicola TaxID=79588 RepID=A0ABQ0CXS7_9HYPO